MKHTIPENPYLKMAIQTVLHRYRQRQADHPADDLWMDEMAKEAVKRAETFRQLTDKAIHQMNNH